MRKRNGLLSLLLITLATPAAAQHPTPALAVDSIVKAALQDGRVAGISVAVVKGRDTVALDGYGFADLEFDVPTPDRALYEIGSVTKQFTAAALLLLQEEGKLSLDDDVSKHLPDYPTHGRRISLRRLLDHTSGIKGYTEMPEFGELMLRKLPRDSLVKLFAAQPFDFEPGEAQIYNNSAYFLLGLIIEKASGMSYGEFVKARLFEPAGMHDSRYCDERAVIKNRANGYDLGPDGKLLRAAYLDHTWPYSAGSLCSTAADLVAWNRALHGGRILSPASYQQLLTPGVLNDGTRLRYALGLALHEVAGHRVIEHGGGINGFLSSGMYFPDDDLIVIVLANTAGPVGPGEIAGRITEAVLGRKETQTVAAFSGDPAAYTGTWSGVGRGRALTINITAENGALKAKMGNAPPNAPAQALRFLGNETFVMGNTRLTFVRAAGAVVALSADMVYGHSLLKKN